MLEVQVFQVKDSSFLDAQLGNWDLVEYNKVSYSYRLPIYPPTANEVYRKVEDVDNPITRSLVVGDILHFGKRYFRIEPVGFTEVMPIFQFVKEGNYELKVLVGSKVSDKDLFGVEVVYVHLKNKNPILHINYYSMDICKKDILQDIESVTNLDFIDYVVIDWGKDIQQVTYIYRDGSLYLDR